MFMGMLAKVLDVCIEILTPEATCGAGRAGPASRALGVAKAIFWCLAAVAVAVGLGQLR
jgi:hypothetical protein